MFDKLRNMHKRKEKYAHMYKTCFLQTTNVQRYSPTLFGILLNNNDQLCGIV